MMVERVRPRTDTYSAGFTLVELLVAMMLLSIMATIGFGSLRFGARAWNGANDRIDHGSTMASAQEFLRRSLEQAYPEPLSPKGEAVVYFYGDHDAVDFIGTLPHQFGAALYGRIHVRIAQSDGTTSLIATIRPDPLPTAPKPVTDWEARSVLVANVPSLAFSYFGKRKGEAEANWHGAWRDQERLPLLIRLAATAPSRDGASLWPDLICAPAIAFDATCVFDAASQRCRGRS